MMPSFDNKRFELGTFLGLSLICCLGPPLDAQVIHATAVDRDTGYPISNASVCVVDSRGAIAAHAFTDSTGSYAVGVPAAGRYALQVRAWGYEPRELGWLDVSVDVPLDLRLYLAPMVEEELRLRGVVMNDSTRAPIGDASLLLLDDMGNIGRGMIADADGFYDVPLPDSGSYSIRIDAEGYQTLVTPQFVVAAGQPVNVEIRLRKQLATQLAAITVTAEAPVYRPMALQDFDRRRERGWGSHMTREQIEATNPLYFTDAVRMMPTVRVVPMPREDGPLSPRNRHYTVRINSAMGLCEPILYWDGVRMGPIDNVDEGGPDTFIFASDLEGIEVYRAAVVPAEFGGSDAMCGVVAVWSRR